eukprot:CAMPEP_0197016944 /NCGR_PEP_ID=MMETSP1380-20130617/79260_1 /TAXON_ID=5936 /ORGANISM="Euplotes crassus, Strain CT5" /LENGTH=534 /DNA_ID=CAMNT_0042443975 /DNA_START=113 /DNA_END=1714 /DNA_ORIENTATION=+
MTTYSDQDSEPIPDIDVITESLNLADYNVRKIEFFKIEHGLDQAWHTVLPQLEGFKTTCDELKEQLKVIKKSNHWEHLVDIHFEIKDVINSLFNSGLMKNYTKQLHCAEFRETRGCRTFVSDGSQAVVSNKVNEIQETITATQVNPLKEALRRAAQRDREKNSQLERLEQDKEELDQTVQTLTQEKDNSEQVSAQRQLEIDSLTQQIQTFEEDQEQHNRQAEEMKQEILALEDTLQQAKNILDHAGLKAIHNAMKKSSDSFNEDSEFTIDVRNTADQELLKALQLFRLPPLKKFTLIDIHSFNKPELITKFLGNALSENVNTSTSAQQEILALEDTLQQSKNILDHAGLKAIHNAMMKSSDSFNEDSQFTIDVNNTADQELLKALQLFRLPPLKRFSLRYISSFNKPELITKFLGNALSENVKYFYFNTNTNSCLDLSPYMDTLTKTLPLIPSRVDLVDWTMTSSQFQDILVAAQKADYVMFYACKIDVGEEVDFGGRLDQAAFTNIDFYGTGWSDKSNWAQNGFEQFKNIVKG